MSFLMLVLSKDRPLFSIAFPSLRELIAAQKNFEAEFGVVNFFIMGVRK